MLARLQAMLFGYHPEPPLFASAVSYGNADATFIRCYDGDTFTVDLPGAPPIIGHSIGVRIRGVDCPEMTDPRPSVRGTAWAAKNFSEARLVVAKTLVLLNLGRDKYFRVLAVVMVDGVNLGEALLQEGLARAYDGGVRLPW